MQDDFLSIDDANDCGDPSTGRMGQYIRLVNLLTERDRAILAEQVREQEKALREAAGAFHLSLRDLRCTVELSRRSAKRKRGRRLDMPPGMKVDRICAALLPRKLYEGVVRHAIEDLQCEYIEAVAKNPECSALWIKLRGYISIVAPVIWSLVTPLLNAIFPGKRST